MNWFPCQDGVGESAQRLAKHFVVLTQPTCALNSLAEQCHWFCSGDYQLYLLYFLLSIAGLCSSQMFRLAFWSEGARSYTQQ